MARRINRLSPRGVETISKPGLHADGGGLYLAVDPSGAKRWTFIYRWQSKRREMGLGGLDAVTLATARQKAGECRSLIDAGKDPIEARKVERAAAQRMPMPTFGEAAETYVRTHRSAFRNAKHFDQWEMTLSIQRDPEGELRPTGYCLTLRNKPVDQIGTAEVLEALKPIWLKLPETASRVRGRIERVLDAERALGHRQGENPARWRGHLDKLLPKRQKLTRGHHKAMPYGELPAFLARLATVDGMGARALEFLILTAARTGEVTGSVAPELALSDAAWIIPPERMKAGREHRVALGSRALEIAKDRIAVSPSAYLFPGQSGKQPIANTTMTKALRAAGGGAFTCHGFRSSFRDWVGEETGFPERLAEAALAHIVGDETERAYRRGDALEKRRKLMQAWEDYCLVRKGNVVPLTSKRKRA